MLCTFQMSPLNFHGLDVNVMFVVRPSKVLGKTRKGAVQTIVVMENVLRDWVVVMACYS